MAPTATEKPKTAGKKPAPKKLPTTTEALMERFKDYPEINVLSRRLSDPTDPGSLPILLKGEPLDHCKSSDHWFKHTTKIAHGARRCPTCGKDFRQWYLRWIGSGEEGRWSTMRAKGYRPVLINELPDLDAIAALYKSERDEYIRRGDRGQEILAKMPLPIYLELQKRELELRKTRQTARRVVAETANEAGNRFGSEAGDIVSDEIRPFVDRRHKTTLSEELGDTEDL